MASDTGETWGAFYNNKVERTNASQHSFNAGLVLFFSSNSHKENILCKQNIFFTFFPLVFILHVVVADHRAAVREGKLHAGICSEDIQILQMMV